MKATSEMETTVTTLTVCRGEEAKEKLVTLSLSTPAIRVAAMKTASISQSEKYITPLKKKNQCANHNTEKPASEPKPTSRLGSLRGRSRKSHAYIKNTPNNVSNTKKPKVPGRPGFSVLWFSLWFFFFSG